MVGHPPAVAGLIEAVAQDLRHLTVHPIVRGAVEVAEDNHRELFLLNHLTDLPHFPCPFLISIAVLPQVRNDARSADDWKILLLPWFFLAEGAEMEIVGDELAPLPAQACPGDGRMERVIRITSKPVLHLIDHRQPAQNRLVCVRGAGRRRTDRSIIQ